MELAKRILIILVVFLATISIFFYKVTLNGENASLSLENKMVKYAEDYETKISTRFLNISNPEIVADSFSATTKRIYYLDTKLTYKGDILGISEVNLSYLYYDIYGNPDIAKLKEVQQETNQAIIKIENEVSATQSQKNIALQLHDILINTIDYDYNNSVNDTIPNSSYTIYGALVLHTAVCDGYSKSYSRLLDDYGIENYLVSVEVMDHSWVLAKIDGDWYHIDVTWDDPVYPSGHFYDNLSHDYFMLSDQEISVDHYVWDPSLPKAIS